MVCNGIFFFFKTLEGTEDTLSPIIKAGSSNVTLNDRSMYLTSKISSVAILDATNSDP